MGVFAERNRLGCPPPYRLEFEWRTPIGRSAMANNGFKVFDSDMHIMEPPDLWERYVAPEFRPDAPRGRTSENVRDLGLIFPNASPAALRTRGTPHKGHNYE